MQLVLSADHHFSIGQEHVNSGKPCQDHALSVASEHMACAVISDGCSAGGETDMGARVLTFATVAAVRAYNARHVGALTDVGVVSEVDTQQRIVLGTVREALGLARDDMLATCGYAFLTKDGALMHLAGDGVTAVLYRDRRIVMYHYDWGRAPFYPQYREEHGGAGYVREHGTPETPALIEEEWCYTPGTEQPFQKTGEQTFTVEVGMRGVTKVFNRASIASDIEAIAVFTDGVLRVDHVDWKDAVLALLSFKTTAGQFAKRRLNRALKDFRTVGKGPMDDIAYAVVHVTVNETEGAECGNTDQNAQGSA